MLSAFENTGRLPDTSDVIQNRTYEGGDTTARNRDHPRPC